MAGLQERQGGEEQLYRLPLSRASTSATPPSSSPSIRPASAPGSGRPTASGSTSSRPTNRRRRREAAPREEVHGQHPQRRDAARRASGRSTSIRTKTKRLTRGRHVLGVRDFTISPDGKWIGFQGGSAKRYERNITAAESLRRPVSARNRRPAASSGSRRTPRSARAGRSFSPDSRWIAFSAPDDIEKYSMTNGRLYLRAVGRAAASRSEARCVVRRRRRRPASGRRTAARSTSTKASRRPTSSWRSTSRRTPSAS